MRFLVTLFVLALPTLALASDDAGSSTPHLTEITAARDDMFEALEFVRRLDRDTAQAEAECIRARQAPMRAMIKVTEASTTEFLLAFHRGDLERAEHELQRVRAARGETLRMKTEAQQCSDQGTVLLGETRWAWSGSMSLTGDDTDEAIPVDLMDLASGAPRSNPF